MISTMKIILMLISSAMTNIGNPVKMGMFVMLIAALALTVIAKMTGSIWLSLIIFLLFMGGILVVFMIISSISPNESPMKMKSLVGGVVVALGLTLMVPSSSHNSGGVEVTTELMYSGFILGLLCLMTLYFSVFVMVLQMKGTPLRTLL